MVCWTAYIGWVACEIGRLKRPAVSAKRLSPLPALHYFTMLTGWINYRDYGGQYWDILTPQGVRPRGSYFLSVKEFATLEDAYKDICCLGGRFYVLATQEATWDPFQLDPSLSRKENIERLRTLLTRTSRRGMGRGGRGSLRLLRPTRRGRDRSWGYWGRGFLSLDRSRFSCGAFARLP